MTVAEIIRQGLHYARTCRSLWLFGFFVGIASGGGSGGGGGGEGRGGGLSLSEFLQLNELKALRGLRRRAAQLVVGQATADDAVNHTIEAAGVRTAALVEAVAGPT